jgi:hypothetical protein
MAAASKEGANKAPLGRKDVKDIFMMSVPGCLWPLGGPDWGSRNNPAQWDGEKVIY